MSEIDNEKTTSPSPPHSPDQPRSRQIAKQVTNVSVEDISAAV